jgi:predicted transposase YbfD/YdcC
LRTNRKAPSGLSFAERITVRYAAPLRWNFVAAGSGARRRADPCKTGLIEAARCATGIQKHVSRAGSGRGVKGPATEERRHFISNLPADAEEFARAVRGHWGIENVLHYVLDVAFGEDGSRLRKGHRPENMAALRKLDLTATRADTETKNSVTGRRKQMAWSKEYLEKLLF